MRRCLAAACAIAANARIFAAGTTLIPAGSTWKYLDDGSDQGTAWREVVFADSSWQAGPAQLGYGDGDEATTVGYIDTDSVATGVQKNATTYFRTTFNVANPTQFTSLALTLTYDDGAAVYINGAERARTANLSANPAYNQFTTSTSPDNTVQAWGVSPTALQAGANTIAVEIHQRSGSSSDISFDLSLVGLSEVNRGPYLQSGTPSSVVVRWRTDGATDSRVIYGDSPTTLTNSATVGTSTTEHEVMLTGLTAGTRYYYAVGSSTQIFEGADADTFFVTPPTPGTETPTRIWVIGDAGTANSNQRNVRNAYYNFTGSTHTDLWLMLGDNAYNSGTDAEYQAAVFDLYDAVLRKSVAWPTLGNHDALTTTAGGVNPYFDIFTLPTLGEAGGVNSTTEHYYSFDHANIHFVCLDSQTAVRSTNGAMHMWLENDLEQTTQKWIIAFWHHPPYSKGSHNSDSEAQLVEMRENFLPLLEAQGVDLVLAGHSHAYERSKLIDGFYATPTVTASGTFKDSGNGKPDGNGAYGKNYGPHNGAVYTVAGSSGKVSGGDLDHPVMFTSLNVLGSVILDVNSNQLDAKFLDDQGAIRDYFTIIKGPVVTINVNAADAAEWGTQPGSFTIARTGPTTTALSVNLNLTGAAMNGVDYQALASPVTIPVSASSIAIPIQPLADDEAEGPEDVDCAIAAAGSYGLGSTTTGTVTIADRPMDQWRFENFTATELLQNDISGFFADAEGDGQQTIAEYLFFLLPKQPDIPAITRSIESGKLTLVYTRRKSAVDVSITPEVTSDLALPWDSGPAFIDVFPPVDLGDGRETVKVQDKTVAAPSRYMRLRIERP